MTETSVLISGGGPCGLAAAVELGRRGIDCVVLEPRVDVSYDRPRAKTTSVRSMELFRRWGLADRIREVAPVPVAWSQDAVFCTSLLGCEITRLPNIFSLTTDQTEIYAETSQQIPQPLVERVLRDALADLPSVSLDFGWATERVDEQSDGVCVRATGLDGSTRDVRAQYVLGCEGSVSPTRAAIGARYGGRSDVKPNFNMVFRAPGLGERIPHGPAVHYWVINEHTPGLVGRLDLDQTWWAMAMNVDADTGNQDPQRLIAGLVGESIDATVISTDPWTARMLLVDRYASDRMFLVGDAAHLNPPWGGHGFNTGLGDAVNIGWKIAARLQGWGGPGLLDSYARERRPIAEWTIDVAESNMSILAGELAAVRHDPEAIRRAKEPEFYSLGLVLGYAYEDSPIVAHDVVEPTARRDAVTFIPRARPGARLPHRWLADGRSLFDALGSGLTLVRWSDAARTNALVDAARRRSIPLTVLDLAECGLQDAYAAALLLVRPDQHIAWRTTDTVSDAEAHRIFDAILGWTPAEGGRRT